MSRHAIPMQPRYGRLTLEERIGGEQSQWRVKCDCGVTKIVSAGALRCGSTTSCGCWKREMAGECNKSHGMTRTPEHVVWVLMRQRCNNPKANGYDNYGGRGITVCDRWGNFSDFLADMGHKPTPKHQIDRIDNDGPYDPSNCRWATQATQSNNRRTTVMVEYHGKRMSRMDAWEMAGRVARYRNVVQRIQKLGWTVERAVETAG